MKDKEKFAEDKLRILKEQMENLLIQAYLRGKIDGLEGTRFDPAKKRK